MSFPPEPKTDDEYRSQLLKLMEVPGRQRLYVLGSFARYVTVYAQQIRAFNLIDALVKEGRVTDRSHVAVVGGGIAGMTAAAAAAVRGVERVAVFEKLGNTMRIQRGTEKRFIHPHIYDWPMPRALEKQRADHDIMNWGPDRAAEVIEELDRGWQQVRDRHRAAEEPRRNCKRIEVEQHQGRWRIVADGKDAGSFDIAILAVGFGRDATKTTEGYWTDTSLDSADKETGATWLVSGLGDGGLTDLMRLCIMDFKHRTAIETINAHSQRNVGEYLLKCDSAGLEPDELAAVFLDAARMLKPALRDSLRPRPLGSVLLNCKSDAELCSARSSLLNRLIVAYLRVDGRFELVGGGRIAMPVERSASGRYRVVFRDGASPPREVDHVVLRHGPKPALEEDFPEVWRRCRRLRTRWGTARQHADWTRKPLYEPGDFALGRSSRLRRAVGGRTTCIVITGTTAPGGMDQTQRVAAALRSYARKVSSRQAGRIDDRPAHISAIEALSSPADYEWTLRALCDCEIAVFDVTDHEAAVMLFLGVRASVRRGVTLAVAKDPAQEPLPFNLGALNPSTWRTSDAAELGSAIENGLAALRAQPTAYLDLPAFSAVRDLGEDYRPQPAQEQVLVLRWFDRQYGEMIPAVFADAVYEAVGDTRVITTLDSTSPQLVDQRLYAAIRRSQGCIADWTGWRPNVMFETGVRLAVNAKNPIIVRCAEPPPGWDRMKSRWPSERDPSADALDAFFDPLEFTFSNLDKLTAEIKARLAPGAAGPRGVLSEGRTYNVVCEAIPTKLEPGGMTVEQALVEEAERIAGPEVPEEGGFPLLYSEALADQARAHAVETLLATWHYLDAGTVIGAPGLVQRVRDGELASTDPALEPLRRVGLNLSARLRSVGGSRYAALAIELSGALADIDAREEGERSVVEEVRRLKGQAMDARDAGEFARAVRILRRAEKLLRATLADFERRREAGRGPGRQEQAVANQLLHILGTIGGVHRRNSNYKAAVAAYDAGYDFEKADAGYGIVNSYNLVQRLVARVLHAPTADLIDELEQAREALESQIAGPRRHDEYAAADLMTVLLLLGHEEWDASLDDFLDMRPERYAVDATLSMLQELHTRVTAARRAPARLAERLTEAIETLTAF